MLSWRSLTKDQIAGADFIASRPVSLLADKPGLGKTAQLVQAVDLCAPRRTLVICPPILRENIAREFERFSLFAEPVTILRSGKDRLPAGGIVAVSYQLATKGYRELNEWRPEFVACDEAHALKEPGSERAKAVVGRKRRIVEHAGRMLWMSGTPAPNHIGEFYTFARAAGVWRDTQEAFHSRYCKTVDTPYGLKIVGNKNVDELKALLANVMLRRTVIHGLPPLRVSSVPVPGDIRALHNEIDDATRRMIVDAANADDWQFLEAEFIATVRRLAGIAKAPSVADLVLNELEAGEPKLLVFAYHKEVIAALQAAFAARGFEAPTLDGSTPERRRQAIIDNFESPTGARVNIWQEQSASEGLTAVSGRRIVLAEPPWSPRSISQMIARVWRKRQTREVVASLCTLAGSIDDTIIRTLERKNRLLAEVL